jgi:hypothetical protein
MAKNSFELTGRIGDFEFLTYLTPPVTISGTILCSLCIVVFSQPSFGQKLYKFLKYESIFIACDLLIKSGSPVTYCKSCALSTTLFSCVYLIYFCVYLSSICEMSALICNILSALFCHLHISKLRMQKPVKPSLLFVLININHRIIVCFIVLFSACLYSYQLFQFEINHVGNSTIQSENFYVVEPTSFYYSDLNMSLEIISHSIRDGFNLTILIIVNTLLIIKIRRNLKQKSTTVFPNNHTDITNIQTCNKFSNNVHFNDSNSNKLPMKIPLIVLSQKKITKLIVINCFNTILGRLPIFLYFILRNVSSNSIYINFLGAFSFFFVYFCYFTKFFLFYFTNCKFREEAKGLFLKCKCNKSSRV